MEAPHNHGLPRAVMAAIAGAVIMAAAVVGIALGANADTTNDATAPAQADQTTTSLVSDEPAPAVTTTAPADHEAPDAEAAFQAEYEETYGPYESCMEESGVYGLPYPEDGEVDESDLEASEAAWLAAEEECSLLLPPEIQEENAAWRAHGECVEAALGPNFWDDDNWNEADYNAADLECRSVLPDRVREELAAWDAYNACTDEFMGPEAFAISDNVSVSSAEEYLSYVLGEGDGSITITKVDGELVVTVDGDVTVQDEAYWEAENARWMEAEAACIDLQPEMAD